MPFFVGVSYWLEVLATTRFPKSIITCMIIINMTLLLVYPVIFSFYLQSHYAIGAYFLLYATSMCLKLISFHHTFADVRYVCVRTVEAQKQGIDLKPSKIEGTIFGVSKSVYDIAVTYPKCLNFTNYSRFIIAPTCCYQLEYPLIEKRRWWKILEHLVEFVICNVLMAYIFTDHIVPNAHKSLIHFE